MAFDSLCTFLLYDMSWRIIRKRYKFPSRRVDYNSSDVSFTVLAILIGSKSNHFRGVKYPHNVMKILLGMDLLWFGWFWFNDVSQVAVGNAELIYSTKHISDTWLIA